MREIKFKAICSEEYHTDIDCIEEGDFVYGIPTYYKDEMQCIMQMESGGVGSGLCIAYVPINKETLGQFTGLRDKNGKDIYEGDVVNARITIEAKDGDDFDYYSEDEHGNRKKMSCSLKPSVVEYTDCGYVFKHKSGKTTSFWISPNNIKEKYEIIGNIHENPELL